VIGQTAGMAGPSIHATAILWGYRGILIRGPSGSGKSRLALSLLQSHGPELVRLIGDDRIHLEAMHGRLLMRPAQVLAGRIEIRGQGIARLPFEPVAVAHLVVDLDASDSARLPEAVSLTTDLLGVRLARLPVAPGVDARVALLARLDEKCQWDSA